MGISWRQSRTGRASGGNRDPRIPRGIGDHDLGAVPGAVYVRVAHLPGLSTPDASLCVSALGRHSHGARAHLPGLSTPDASLCVSALGRHSHGARAHRAQVVEAARTHDTGDAAGRSAARRHAARSALASLLRDVSGATAIEYALIASLISILIIAGITQIGTALLVFYTLASNL